MKSTKVVKVSCKININNKCQEFMVADNLALSYNNYENHMIGQEKPIKLSYLVCLNKINLNMGNLKKN